MRALLVATIGLVSCGGRLTGDASGSLNGVAAPTAEPPSGAPGSSGPVAGNPPPVAGPGAVALQVAVGGFHACALIVDGTVSCWGSNLYHEIGNNAAQEANPLPMKVTGLNGVTAIAAGGYHTCVLAMDRTVSCWGWNQAGQLGDGTTHDSETPVRVVGLSDVVEIAAGALHTCARIADQTMRCWGLNHQGELGDGRSMVEAQTSPVAVSGLAGAISISAGDLFTCAALADGSARCWGDDCEGQVGDGVSLPSCFRPLPTPVATLGSVVSISAADTACAATSDGRVYCWGTNNGGGSNTPQLVAGLGGITSVAAGVASCALDRDSAVWCWGGNQSGVLGDGTTNPRMNPAIVPGLSTVKQLSNGGLMNICALQHDGRVFCWGRNDGGEVGDGTTADRHSPSPVAL